MPKAKSKGFKGNKFSFKKDTMPARSKGDLKFHGIKSGPSFGKYASMYGIKTKSGKKGSGKKTGDMVYAYERRNKLSKGAFIK